ncbi:MAG: fumarylacetoacetate hydrolase family protein [Planctomycetes bacterium]|nr:fumarylacetoacetate hydrolase family protein [Planctomycetota bacterium]
MRIVRFTDGGGQVQTVRDLGDGNADLLQGEMFSTSNPLRPTGKRVPIGKPLAPITPVNIFCIGLNYREHAKEGGNPIPEAPVVFMKPTTALAAPGQVVKIPHACPVPEVDYECELAVVLGREARNVSEADALKYVYGYTAANDVSARRWQKNNGTQWVRGKGFDTFCPLGPALVTAGPGADEIADPQTLALKTVLNGQVMQSHTTADMIFSVAQIIAFLSQDTTLLPGTVILTGTPQGVGVARKPPVFLKAGDEVVIEVEKIGRLVNRVEQA